MAVPVYTGQLTAQTDPNKTALTVTGRTSQSVDIFDVTLTSGGTKVLGVTSGGGVFTGSSFGSAGVTAGDLTVSRSATAAEINFGSGTTAQSGSIFFSSNIFQFFTANSAAGPALQITAAPNVYFAPNASISVPITTSGLTQGAGDVVTQRSASGGAYYAGGATHAGSADYNLSTGSQWSFKNESGFSDISGGTYHTGSDATLKSNIAPIASGTAEILALIPSSFTLNATQKPSLGFIAQDVQLVLPDLVISDNTGKLLVNYSGIIPVLVKAFQEMTASLRAAGVSGF